MALAKTEDLPPEIATRVVPGLCRAAVEAAAHDAVRRRDIAAGVSHADVEDRLAAADKLTKLLALVLHGDTSALGSISADIESRWGRSMAQLVRRLNKGTHAGDDGDLVGMIRNSEQLTRYLAAIA
jgi:hypothetical protein